MTPLGSDTSDQSKVGVLSAVALVSAGDTSVGAPGGVVSDTIVKVQTELHGPAFPSASVARTRQE